jgi:hypothetical protein
VAVGATRIDQQGGALLFGDSPALILFLVTLSELLRRTTLKATFAVFVITPCHLDRCLPEPVGSSGIERDVRPRLAFPAIPGHPAPQSLAFLRLHFTDCRTSGAAIRSAKNPPMSTERDTS